MAEITREQIEELRGLLTKATKGPWSTHLVDDTTIISPEREVATTCDSSQTEREDGYNIEYEQMEIDAALIVTMRNALPALLDIAEKVIAEPSDPKPTSDLLSRLASAQIEVNARGWYGLDVLLNEAETAIQRLEQAKGGDADADPAGSNSSTKSIPATSPGVTAGASETQEALYDLDGFSSCGDHLTEVPLVTRMRTVCGNAAALIRRLVAERDEAREERDIWRSVFPDIAPASVVPDRSLLESRAAAAEAEVERLRAALKPFADRASRYDPDENDNNEPDWCTAAPSIRIGDLRRARTALEGKSDG